jgi:hypothetical protein
LNAERLFKSPRYLRQCRLGPQYRTPALRLRARTGLAASPKTALAPREVPPTKLNRHQSSGD